LPALKRQRLDRPAVDLGDEEPLYTRNLTNAPPDRRRVSVRWLAGSVLTGILSAALIGGALQAAIGVDEYLVVRPALAHGAFGEGAAVAAKGDRFRPVPETKVTRRVIQISTVTRSGDRDIVRVRPYAHVHTNLAAPVEEGVAARIPDFSAADVFVVAEGEEAAPMDAAVASDSIYGAEVDGEVAIKVVDFPLNGLPYEESAELDEYEVEQTVRAAAPDLAEGAVQVASLPYVDPARFETSSAEPGALGALTVAITPENVSLMVKTDEDSDLGIEEKLLAIEEGVSLRKLLMAEGADEDAAARIQSALVANSPSTSAPARSSASGWRRTPTRAPSARCASAFISPTAATSPASPCPTTAYTSLRSSRRSTRSWSWRRRRRPSRACCPRSTKGCGAPAWRSACRRRC
jgi:hypothetical protein